MNSLATRVVEGANPILVKEVRAALRGRWFKVTFSIVLALAVVVSLGFLAFTFGEDGSPSGDAFFRAVYLCAGLGVNMLVPFAAMLSMNAESDENTLELLQLSGISGWRVVAGKLASAMIQAVLVLSAFLPFLAFAFLLRGVDAASIAVAVVYSLAACATQSSLGILLGTLARARWARVVWMLLFGLFLLQSSQVGVLFALGAFFAPGFIGGGTGLGTGLAVGLLVLASLAVTFVSFAAARLAHVEENRSTPVRVTTTVLVIVGVVLARLSGGTDPAVAILCTTTFLIAVPLWLVVSEREPLPRAVAADLPRWARRFPFLAPWLPGGGLGAVYVVLHLSLIVGAMLWPHAGSVSATHASDVGTVLVLALTFVVYLLLVPGVMSFVRGPVSQPAIVRGAVVAFVVVLNLTPVLASALLATPELATTAPLAMPFALRGTTMPPPLPSLVLLSLVAIAVLVNVPRVLAGFRGVATARARARTREEGGAERAATGI